MEETYEQEIQKWKYYRQMINRNKMRILKYGKSGLIQKIYYERMQQNLNLHKAITFNEKINARKLEKNKLFEICADKVKVRKYVASKIGEKYLIPQYFSKKSLSIKDLKKLPNEFILKTSNGSGTNIIVFDKRQVNLKSLCKTINYFKKVQYGYIWGEYYYNRVPIRIVAEKLLKDENGNIPDDLKIHCFDNGKKKHKIIECHYKVKGKNYKNCYDEKWHKLNYVYGFKSDGRKINKPDNLDEILYVCDKLSEDTNYVRVDLYNIKGKLYFGELTFIPGAGYAPFEPESANTLWGKYMGKEKKYSGDIK